MIALIIILCVALFTMLAPKRLFPWAIAVAVPAYAWLYWIITRPLPSNDNWGSLDRAIIWIILIFGVILAAGRLVLVRAKYADLPTEIDWRPAKASSLFVAIWGGAWLLTPHVPHVAGAATCLAIALVLTIIMFAMANRSLRYRAMFIASALALISGIGALLIWPSTIIAAAEKRADGRPYCIVVAHGVDYRTANNLLDLTPLIMRGQAGRRSALNYHGQLLISGEARRNWSYEHRDFLDESTDNEPPSCAAAIGFSRKLPWF